MSLIGSCRVGDQDLGFQLKPKDAAAARDCVHPQRILYREKTDLLQSGDRHILGVQQPKEVHKRQRCTSPHALII